MLLALPIKWIVSPFYLTERNDKISLYFLPNSMIKQLTFIIWPYNHTKEFLDM